MVLRNPMRAPLGRLAPSSREPLAFHRRLPGYHPSPLVRLAGSGDRLGVARLMAKAETERLGLPAFKILGASWATFRAVTEVFEARTGRPVGPWLDVTELAALLAPLRPFTLATATDGNHGRAVARVAAWLGFGARVFVPAGTAKARIEAIESDGADVSVVDGDYDAAVARAAAEASSDCLVVSDTSWPGYDVIPRRVAEGYSTIFWELDEGLGGRPDALVVPIGVGALAAAAVTHYRAGEVSSGDGPLLVGVEPADAACVLESARAGRLVSVSGPHRSIMAGLNCGTPSMVAWPKVSAGFDWFVAMDDEWARAAMRDLAVDGVVAGETGAAALGGLAASIGLIDDARLRGTVVVLCTEGATDPAAYRAIVGSGASATAQS